MNKFEQSYLKDEINKVETHRKKYRSIRSVTDLEPTW
jgi:hypothetical protein